MGKCLQMGPCLVLMMAGCTPDRASVSLNVRQVKGSHRTLTVNDLIPIGELRLKKKLDERLDAYVKLQYIQGELAARHPIANGDAGGQLMGGGLGLDYFPWPHKRWLGLELGAEFFSADYEMRGRWGPIKLVEPDRLWGAGLNLGLVGEIPLGQSERWRVIWGAGYNLTETNARRARVDLGGWYGLVGLEISLK